MYNLIDKELNITHFTEVEGLLFLIRDKSLFLNGIEISSQNIKDFGPISLFGFDKKVFVQDWDGNYLIYKINDREVEVGKEKFFFKIKNKNLLGVESLNDGILNLSIVKDLILWQKEVELFNHENFCSYNMLYFFKSKEEIFALNEQTGIQLWVYAIPECRYDWYTKSNFEDAPNELQKGEISRIIGDLN